MPEETFINMMTAPPGLVKEAFIYEREKILRQITRLKVDLESANQNRFKDDPIHLSLDFREGIAAFDALTVDQQNAFNYPDDEEET